MQRAQPPLRSLHPFFPIFRSPDKLIDQIIFRNADAPQALSLTSIDPSAVAFFFAEPRRHILDERNDLLGRPCVLNRYDLVVQQIVLSSR